MLLVNKPQALLFDLDGTLAHTLPQLSIAMRQAAKELGVPEPDDATMASFIGNGAKMLIARTLAGKHDVTLEDIPAERLAAGLALFRKYYMAGLHENVSLYPGVLEGLQAFAERGIKMAVVTNKPHIFAEPLVKFLGIDKYMGAVLGSEVIPERKPDPAPLYHVLKQIAVAPQHAVMVGDSVNDVKAGHNAAMPTVAFTFGYDGGYDVRSSDPDYIFDHFSDLTKLITSLPEA